MAFSNASAMAFIPLSSARPTAPPWSPFRSDGAWFDSSLPSPLMSPKTAPIQAASKIPDGTCERNVRQP
jgi:hypothetical protein